MYSLDCLDIEGGGVNVGHLLNTTAHINAAAVRLHDGLLSCTLNPSHAPPHPQGHAELVHEVIPPRRELLRS